MKIQTYKTLSNVMLAAGGISIVGSLAIYALGTINRSEKLQNTGLFVGLWPPSFFVLADRLAVAALDEEERLRGGDVDEDSREQLRSPQSPRPMSHVNR